MRPYPRYLVLEYGIDHPWEMEFLLSIATPDIAIVTPIEPNHLEQFGSLEIYRAHKLMLIEHASTRIIHESLRQYSDLDALYYSLGALSDIDAAHIEMDISGTRAVVQYSKKEYPIILPAIGTFQIENLLPLYPIADILHIDPAHIARYALHGAPETGRSSILSGIHHSTIIDGSYNGGYLSIREGIVSMRSFLHSHRVIFFLGDMRELGEVSRDIHEQLAHEICDIIPHESRVSFYLVGPMMRDYVAPILDPHFHTLSSLSSRESGEQIRDDIAKNKTDTIIYAKWSQNTIFIEEGIKSLLSDLLDVGKLPRQTAHWMDKKNAFFKSLEK
jgi:UDP-N-acetylmuramyl pentapeptide synthase